MTTLVYGMGIGCVIALPFVWCLDRLCDWCER